MSRPSAICQGKGCPLLSHRVQVLLTLNTDGTIHQQLVRPDEMTMSMQCFIEMARKAGWSITPQHTSEE